MSTCRILLIAQGERVAMCARDPVVLLPLRAFDRAATSFRQSVSKNVLSPCCAKAQGPWGCGGVLLGSSGPDFSSCESARRWRHDHIRRDNCFNTCATNRCLAAAQSRRYWHFFGKPFPRLKLGGQASRTVDTSRARSQIPSGLITLTCSPGRAERRLFAVPAFDPRRS